ncbi:hypothetical protein DV515_00004240, partial [Chloebia gouldiae]
MQHFPFPQVHPEEKVSERENARQGRGGNPSRRGAARLGSLAARCRPPPQPQSERRRGGRGARSGRWSPARRRPGAAGSGGTGTPHPAAETKGRRPGFARLCPHP